MDEHLPGFEEHYELGPELGRGAFGAVHRARRREDGGAAAAKLLHQASPDMRARVRREADLVRDVAHPCLVRLHGLFLDAEGVPVLVYDLIEGRTLEERVRDGEASPEQVGRWVLELAEGLAALHAAGLVHRDLKPENVMIDLDGRARLLDYGLARPEEAGRTMTAEGLILGTPAFMAPEVFEGGRPSPADDVYALACLAYAALAGRPAHTGENPAEILATKRLPVSRLPRLAELQAAQLANIDAVLARALSPEAKERYPDPAALASALQEALSGATQESAQGDPTVRLAASRPARRAPRDASPMSTGLFLRRTASRWIPALVVVVLVVLALSVGGGPEQPVPGASPDSSRVPATVESPARTLVRELGRQLAQLPDEVLAGDDPMRFGALLEHAPALVAHLEARARGEVEWHDLAEPDRQALLQVSSDLRGQGLPDPFWPLLDVRPGESMAPGDEPVLEEFRSKFGPAKHQDLIAAPSPWLQTAWARVITARRLGEALEDELNLPTSPAVVELGIQPAALVTSDALGVFATHFDDPRRRALLDRVLRDERRAYQAAIWAVGRVIRHSSPAEAEEAARMLWEIAADYRFLFYSHLALLRPEALLGVPGTTPAGACAVYRLTDTQTRARRHTPFSYLDEGPGRRDELADRMIDGPLTTGIEVFRAREALGSIEERYGSDSPEYTERRDRLMPRLEGAHAGWYLAELRGVR